MEFNVLMEIHTVINTELEGIKMFKEQVDGEYVKAVELIHACCGKVVVTGIGKSGIIARKIASTMASTGTLAIFLHPAEGMHGDLGVIGKDDVVIALSKSGESHELHGILPVIKKIGATIIAITGNSASSLAKHADVVLNVGDLTEACPFNTAPTTSTTVSLVLGDALAVTLMKMKNFDMDDFALFHPGGRIGKRLITAVSDVMLSGTDNPVIDIYVSTRKMLTTITAKQAGAVSVVNGDGKLVGLITDFDLRRALERHNNIFPVAVSEIMNPNPVSINQKEKAYTALKTMQSGEKGIVVLPVVDDDGKAVGMVRLMDIVKAGL